MIKRLGETENTVSNVGNTASSKDVGRALAVDSVESVIECLRIKAHRQDDVLSVRDIDAMGPELAALVQKMETRFESVLESYVTAVDQQKWNLERSNPFSRLLVKQFSHLFKEPPGRKSVHRRVLPGFYQAVTMLLGPETVGRYHDRCERIVTRIKAGLGDASFSWEPFYIEKDALSVSLDSQLLIAAGFQDFDKRSRWFLDLVNSNLAPVADDASAGEQAWHLSERGLRRMLAAFFDDLRKVLSSEKGREHMVKRHGSDVVGVAVATLERLAAG